MGLLLRRLCYGYGYGFIGTDMAFIPGNQLYCRFQDITSEACVGQACNMMEISSSGRLPRKE